MINNLTKVFKVTLKTYILSLDFKCWC